MSPLKRTNTVKTSFILALGLALLSASAQGQDTEVNRVFDLIDQRLSLMKPVAHWKFVGDVPVEDLEREAIVLRKTIEAAATANLDPAAVSSFFRLQIELAKAVQHRHMAHWTLEPPTDETPTEDLETSLRPRLIRIGERSLTAVWDLQDLSV